MDGMFLDKRFNREFCIVRDNRFNQNANLEAKPPSVQSSTPRNEPMISNTSGKSRSAGTSGNQKPPVGRFPSLSLNGPAELHPKHAGDVNSSGTDRKEIPEKRPLSFPNTALLMQAVKPNDSRPHSATSSSSSVVGLYSSSSDPVHVPSSDSRPATNVGIIKREVGIVGVRRQPSENPVNLSSAQTSSSSNSNLGRDGTSKESFRYFNAISKSDQPSQTAVSESSISSMSVSRSFLNNHYSNRPHQQPVGRQKAPQPNKEWKPKSSQKASIIGAPAKSVSPPADHSEDSETDVAQLQDKLSQINISVNQKVIIASHLRVSETERCRLTFGSLGAEFESSRNSGFLAVVDVEASSVGPSASLLVSASETSGKETPGSKQEVHLVDGYVRNSGSNSPASPGLKHQLADKKVSSSPPNLDHHGDIGLVQDNNPSYTPSKSQQLQDPTELPDFSAYDPPTVYDTPYFRPTVDESVRGPSLPFLREHALVQQHPMTQMYPQVHVSHFGNLMPYRQFISPVYVAPMAMPGYSSNPAYPHPSNGNSYLLMPGGSSHLTAGGLKHGMQQFKPVPSGSPTGYGSFTSPTGYAINAPGGVGNATGLEDSSRLKYNDSNLYVPNPQAETSEIWMNPRDAPSLQSASYYNMPAQTPHAAYLPSHTGHASFNPAAAVAQSSHMQFPGLYHPPPQPTPHHMGPAASAMRW